MAGNHNANPVVPEQARILAPGRARRTVVAEQRSSNGVGLQVRKPKRNAFTLAKQAKFFVRLAETSNVKAAAEHAGVCPTTIWNWRRKDAEFARAWAMALAQGYADLEMRMLAQARFGATSEAEVIDEGDGKRRARARRDPPATSHGDACGIIVVGRTADGLALVLHDASVERASPDQWARAVATMARRWGADRVVAEANNGGEMVAQVLRAAMETLPLKLVHATRSKVARAEPVATLYERGRVRHAGALERLEDELCGLMPGGGYAGPGRSPDRADAAIWALTELMLSGRSGVPGIRAV